MRQFCSETLLSYLLAKYDVEADTEIDGSIGIEGSLLGRAVTIVARFEWVISLKSSESAFQTDRTTPLFVFVQVQ